MSNIFFPNFWQEASDINYDFRTSVISFRTSSLLKIFLLLLLVLPISNSAQISEYEMKIIFIEKFNDFIEFPEIEDNTLNKNYFQISVIGDNPFGNNLKLYFSGKSVSGKAVKVKNISALNEIRNSDLLFISSSEQNRIDQILSYTYNKPIITIGDTEGYCELGVLINFYMENNRVRFEINFDAVQKSGLYMNYRLLKLAKVINSLEIN